MREQKWTKRDKKRNKRRTRKPDSGRSVFEIQRIQRERAIRIARKEKENQ